MARKTAHDVAHDLKNHEIQCSERWTTAFKHFEKLDDDINGLNNWIKDVICYIGYCFCNTHILNNKIF